MMAETTTGSLPVLDTPQSDAPCRHGTDAGRGLDCPESPACLYDGPGAAGYMASGDGRAAEQSYPG